MNTNRSAEITSLLTSVEAVYCGTLGDSGYDDGTDSGLPQEMATEIVVRAVLVELLKSGLTSRSKLQKAVRSLPLYPGYPGG